MTVCLNMIVKDEAAVIARCLTSVRNHIGTWAILDTGSTDDTKQIVRETLAGIPGVLADGEFHNFAQARNEALALGREQGADWLLLTDADMTLEAEPGWLNHAAAADAWAITWTCGDLAYPQPRLVNPHAHATYIGATHEYLDVHTAGTLPGVRFIEHADSGTRHEKFPRDLRLLTAAVEQDPDDARSVFYLANTQRDLGHHADAHATYQRRAAMGGWDEEAWYALYQTAAMTERLGDDPVAAYLTAHDARPTRAEPLVDLARWHREHGQHHAAYLFAKAATETPRPSDVLFVDIAAHGWRAWDELSIAAYWTGRRGEAHTAAMKALAGCPEAHRDRIATNLGYCAA